MKYYAATPDEVKRSMGTDLLKGLTKEEVEKRRKEFGYNELAEGEKQSALLLFFSQFKDFMVIVLLGATLISGLLGEYIDAIAIMAIVLLNGLLGFFQERKAEKSLEALKTLSAPKAQVLRNGQWIKIPSRELVPGDVIRFSSGDRVGADVRLIEISGLEIEESALTGESVPVTKSVSPIYGESVSLGDLKNIAFMGTMVTRGS